MRTSLNVNASRLRTPAPATQTETEFTLRYENAPFHARGFALAAEYGSDWRPHSDDSWHLHPYYAETWVHPAYPRHVLWKPQADLVVVTQLAATTPREPDLLALARLALGPISTPLRSVCYPLVFRLPLRITACSGLRMPSDRFRCRRLWPAPGEQASLESVEGVSVEFRVTASTTRTGVKAYAEAFIGGAYETCDGTPRALIFPADARRVLQGARGDLRRFTSRLMDGLLRFAHRRQTAGLEVEGRRLGGRLLGRVQMAADNDVEFRINMPQPGGPLAFIGSWVRP